MYMWRFESNPRQLIFLWKVTALGVLCYFDLIVVCMTLLASFFCISHQHDIVDIHIYTFVLV